MVDKIVRAVREVPGSIYTFLGFTIWNTCIWLFIRRIPVLPAPGGINWVIFWLGGLMICMLSMLAVYKGRFWPLCLYSALLGAIGIATTPNIHLSSFGDNVLLVVLEWLIFVALGLYDGYLLQRTENELKATRNHSRHPRA